MPVLVQRGERQRELALGIGDVDEAGGAKRSAIDWRVRSRVSGGAPIVGAAAPCGQKLLSPAAIRWRLACSSSDISWKVLIANRPPGRSSRAYACTAAAASGRKNSTSPASTASKLPLGKSGASASPNPTVTWVSPSRSISALVSVTMPWARSTPVTEPLAPTAAAAGNRLAPRPKPTAGFRC